MGSYSYVSLTSLKSQLNDTSTTYDALYREKLEAASEQVDQICNRTFRIYLATVYLTAVRADRVLLPADLLAVTSLRTDPYGDRDYPSTWDVSGADTDIDLLPEDADLRRRPYGEIATSPGGDWAFPVNVRKGVELVGRWGFWQELASAGTLGASISSDSATSITMTAGHGIEALQTLLIDSEQVYVTAVATNTLTVERGVNGTTAATHANGATVQRYRYPAPVVDVTQVIAEELLRPFGVAGRVDDSQRPAIVMLPHYVTDTLAHYRVPVAV